MTALTLACWLQVQPCLAEGRPAGTDTWKVECRALKDSTAPRSCYMVQVVFDAETDRPVLQVSFQRLPGRDRLAAVLVVPLLVMLRPGLEISVDKGEAMPLRYELCTLEGCVVQFVVSDELLAAMKAGLRANVSLMLLNGETIVLPFSLEGFTAALAALRSR